jgi:hypothetical protein
LTIQILNQGGLDRLSLALSQNRYVKKAFPASSSDQDFLTDFSTRATNSYRDAFDKVDLSLNVKSALEYARYCDAQLRYLEDPNHVFELSIDTATNADLVIEFIFNILSLGSIEAIEFVPRLLQLISFYPGTRPLFKRLVPNVPSWMFLNWISQLTAVLDTDLSEYVFLILYDLVQDFPGYHIFY